MVDTRPVPRPQNSLNMRLKSPLGITAHFFPKYKTGRGSIATTRQLKLCSNINAI